MGFFKRLKHKLGFHQWDVHQYIFFTDSNRGALHPGMEVVIAWKQCGVCGKSKLIHILK